MTLIILPIYCTFYYNKRNKGSYKYRKEKKDNDETKRNYRATKPKSDKNT